MPTGGITSDNIQQYLDIPAVLACGGTWMVDKKLINDKKWDEIGLLIKDIVAKVK